MRIERITTRTFRNLTGVAAEFSAGVNVFVGPNGHGKTNILEAIYYFKFARSFRTRRDTDLVSFDQPHAAVECVVSYDAGDAENFRLNIPRDARRKIRMAGKPIEKSGDLIGRYPCVLFGPHDLDVVSGEPARRRRFIDAVGSMMDRRYLDAARSYSRILKQRNAALRARRGADTLGALTRQLCHAGAVLVGQRAAAVESLRSAIKQHAAASGSPYVLEIRYECSIRGKHAHVEPREQGIDDPTDVVRQDERDLEERLAEMLQDRADEEQRRMTTLVGPHRDDLAFTFDGRDLRRFGSQGQRRLFAVLLRMAELSNLEDALGERCVLLLDDVFAEFDEHTTKRLQGFLEGERQVFVTTPVPLEWVGNARVFTVNNGDIAHLPAIEGER